MLTAKDCLWGDSKWWVVINAVEEKGIFSQTLCYISTRTTNNITTKSSSIRCYLRHRNRRTTTKRIRVDPPHSSESDDGPAYHEYEVKKWEVVNEGHKTESKCHGEAILVAFESQHKKETRWGGDEAGHEEEANLNLMWIRMGIGIWEWGG